MNTSALVSLPVISRPAERSRLPRWLRRDIPAGGGMHRTAALLRDLRLETVCESAKCPNQMECWSRQTATFMILGDVCTRPCGFCAVTRGRPLPVQEDEPTRLAAASRRLGLSHVVITSVTRDDLPDQGAEHFCRCVTAIRQQGPATVEVLTPDFIGDPAAVDRVIDARPDVFNHNCETVPRLFGRVRGPRSNYRWTLSLLRRVKSRDASIRTKSGLMLGLGETTAELLDTIADLLGAGCDMLTLGQYLAPSPRHLPVTRYLPPEEFDELGRMARRIGFRHVASGPFVRSSYHARELADEALPPAVLPAPRGAQEHVHT